VTYLTDQGLLTPFQSRQLLAGKSRGFFLENKYKVLDLLGFGGMGQVFLCEHLMLQRLVAVKILQQAALDSTTGGRAIALERFVREARAIAALDHPNIVRVYDMERSGAVAFIVMEYVDGTNLHQIVTQTRPLAVDRAAHYVSQAAAGLQHAHEHGLVHRDVKPGNLLLDRSGIVKLLDLGLARFRQDVGRNDNVTARYHEQQAVVGTADYMSPEQGVDSNAVDIRSDIYSLSATAYFLLTGRAPFEGEPIVQKMLGHQVREPVSIRSLRCDVPIELVEVVERMTAKNPVARYATPADVVAALRPWTAEPIAPPVVAEMPDLLPTEYRLGLSSPGDSTAGRSELPSAPDRSGIASDTPWMAEDRTSAQPGAARWQPEPTAPLPPTKAVGSTQPAARTERATPLRSPMVISALVGASVLLVGALIWWLVVTGGKRTDVIGPPSQPVAAKTGDLPIPLPTTVGTGSGSTFIKPAMDYWAPLYEQQTGVKIKYDGIGSGRGVDNMIDRVLNFGCTDAPLTEVQLAKARATSPFRVILSNRKELATLGLRSFSPGGDRMLLGRVFERFAEQTPVCVAVRALMESALNDEALDELFGQVAERQYEQDLLFSTCVDLMAGVVCRTHRSMNAAYNAAVPAVGRSPRTPTTPTSSSSGGWRSTARIVRRRRSPC
jgi:eukaryotic-like serine/threonine-protein kinase